MVALALTHSLTWKQAKFTSSRPTKWATRKASDTHSSNSNSHTHEASKRAREWDEKNPSIYLSVCVCLPVVVVVVVCARSRREKKETRRAKRNHQVVKVVCCCCCCCCVRSSTLRVCECECCARTQTNARKKERERITNMCVCAVWATNRSMYFTECCLLIALAACSPNVAW